ncbi:hypothetical protein HF313_19425 [Massilia atriviolacea]|uniref:Uncharacterized protein n=1 Tax=Massilia atriviolacea TaxID=2495579 RepID=A0A430HSS9_9BURK|nr:hypothetical protein [Massilia atriviolacea]RSZ60524.1 hypothetical protein EJB06_05275 [Massilia atriviolacea]
MPARPQRVTPEDAFIIVQQRGHDRVVFEVNAGKMVSIRVEPEPDRAPGDDITHETALAEMDTRGSC